MSFRAVAALFSILLSTAVALGPCDLARFFSPSQQQQPWIYAYQPYPLPPMPYDVGQPEFDRLPPELRETGGLKWSWQVLNPSECPGTVQINGGKFLVARTFDKEMLTWSQGCKLGIHYSDSYLALWNSGGPLARGLYPPCPSDNLWHNNVIAVEFRPPMDRVRGFAIAAGTHASHRGTAVAMKTGAVGMEVDPDLVADVKFLQHRPRPWLQCDSEAARDEMAFMEYISQNIQAVDRLQPNIQYDLAIVDLHVDTEYCSDRAEDDTNRDDPSPAPWLLPSHCRRCIRVEVGALSPRNDSKVIARSETLSYAVRDVTPPHVSGIVDIRNLLPPRGETQCMSTAIRLAMYDIPRLYNTQAKVTDNCSPSPPPLTFTWSVTNAQCPNWGTVALDWSANDGCGNVWQLREFARVHDTVPPMPIQGVALEQQLMRCWAGSFGTSSPAVPMPLSNLGDIVRHVMRETFRDNCDPAEYLQAQIAWDDVAVAEGCVAKQVRPGSPRERMECRSKTKQQIDSIWMEGPDGGTPYVLPADRLQIPFKAVDSCGNTGDTWVKLEILIAATARTCELYHYLPL